MKKYLLLTLAILLILTGCAKDNNVDGNLSDIMSKVYSEISSENLPMGLTNIEVNEENIEMYLGTSNIEYKEVLASESMIGSIAHSVVLVRTKENADIEKIKEEIKNNVDPRKWICVGVEAEDVIIKNKGDLIIVIIVEDETTRETLEKGFDNL